MTNIVSKSERLGQILIAYQKLFYNIMIRKTEILLRFFFLSNRSFRILSTSTISTYYNLYRECCKNGIFIFPNNSLFWIKSFECKFINGSHLIGFPEYFGVAIINTSKETNMSTKTFLSEQITNNQPNSSIGI